MPNTNIFRHENALEDVVCIVTVILSGSQCANRCAADKMVNRQPLEITNENIIYGRYIGIFNILRPRQNGHHIAEDIFKRISLNETFFNFIWNFTEICSFASNWQYGCIIWDNDLAPNRRQAIVSTNDGLGYWRIYASLGLDEITLLVPKQKCSGKMGTQPWHLMFFNEENFQIPVECQFCAMIESINILMFLGKRVDSCPALKRC